MRSCCHAFPAMMDCILTPGMKINLLLLSRLCCRQEKQLIQLSASQRVEWGHPVAKGVGMLGTCRALLLAAHLPTCDVCSAFYGGGGHCVTWGGLSKLVLVAF